MKVVYTGCSDAQVKFGDCDDPRNTLFIGQEYDVCEEYIHSFHTKYELDQYPGYFFNSVCFKEVEEPNSKIGE